MDSYSSGYEELRGPVYWTGVAQIARYGLEGSGIESRWGVRFSAPIQTVSGAHPASCKVGIGSLSQASSNRDVALTTHLHLTSRLKKE